MKFLALALVILSMQGCIYTQNGTIRNDTDKAVLVGAQSSYSEIAPLQAVQVDFIYCLEVTSPEDTRYYGVPQVSNGVFIGHGSSANVDTPTSKVPVDAYRKGRPLDDVALVFTDDGLFFDSATQGLVPVLESEQCSEDSTAISD